MCLISRLQTIKAKSDFSLDIRLKKKKTYKGHLGDNWGNLNMDRLENSSESMLNVLE